MELAAIIIIPLIIALLTQGPAWLTWRDGRHIRKVVEGNGKGDIAVMGELVLDRLDSQDAQLAKIHRWQQRHLLAHRESAA